MTQSPISLVPIDTNSAGWDIVVQSNAQKVNDYFKTFLFTVTVAGTTILPSQVSIQLQNGDASPVNVLETFKLRVRVVDDLADVPQFDDASNALITDVLTGTLLESFTAEKDILIESDSNGLILLELTDATIEKFWAIIGPSYLAPTQAYYENNQQLEHTV